MTIMFGISSQINSKSHYPVMQYFVAQRGRIGKMSQLKMMPIISCFIRLTGLFFFITIEVTILPQLKNAHLEAQ